MKKLWVVLLILTLVLSYNLFSQIQVSAGGVNIIQIAGTAVATAAAGIMKVGITDSSGNALNSTANALNVHTDGTGSVVLASGTNVIGYVRLIPAGCSAQSTPAQLRAVPVATGAGTSLTATTSCVVSCYANNLTNSGVTIRIQDGQGTPVIWTGGNADFTILPNSNMRLPLAEGTVFTTGVTAIAGTATAINLACSSYQ